MDPTSIVLGMLLVLGGPFRVPGAHPRPLLATLFDESGGGEESPDESGRERFLLERKFGQNAPLEFGFKLNASFLLPLRAGRDIPGTPPRERPGHDELFSPGTGVFAETSYMLRPSVSVLLRLGVIMHSGRVLDEGVLGPGRYGRLWFFPFQGGARFSLPLALPPSAWGLQDFTPPVRGTTPYIELLVGMTHRPAVERDPGGEYWRRATVFSGSARAGIEIRFGSMAVSASAGFDYHSEPPEGVWYAEPEAAMGFSVEGGLSWRF